MTGNVGPAEFLYDSDDIRGEEAREWSGKSINIGWRSRRRVGRRSSGGG
jgi:hypothetical protein